MLTKLLKEIEELQSIQEELKRELTGEEKERWHEYKKIKSIFVNMNRETRFSTLQCLKDVHEFLTLKESLDNFWKTNEEEF